MSEIFATQPPVIPFTIPWEDEATVAEVELKRPNPEDSALTCPDQQANEVIVKHTHDANQAISSLNSAQHSSLVDTSTINLINCDQSDIPTNALLTEDKKSSR
jgi:hypothetical protein